MVASSKPNSTKNRSNSATATNVNRSRTTSARLPKKNVTKTTVASPPLDVTPVGTIANDYEKLLIDMIPYFNEYQTYCVVNNVTISNNILESETSVVESNDDHKNHDKVVLRNRMVQNIIAVCNMNEIILEMTNLSVIDENSSNEIDTTSPIQQCSESKRMTMITECFIHIMDSAIASVLTQSSNSRSTNMSIVASTAILDLLMAVVIEWMIVVQQQKEFQSSINPDEDERRRLCGKCTNEIVSLLVRYSACSNDNIRIISVRALCFASEHLGRISIVNSNADDTFMQIKLDLLDNIQQALLPRFTDKAIAVRCATIQACFPLTSKNPLCNDPDLLQAIQWIVQHDPSPNNRMVALQHVPINRRTLEYIIPRIRDTKVNVRIAAITALTKAVLDTAHTDCTSDTDGEGDVSQLFLLQSRHIAEIITTGYTDRCLATKDAIRRMVCTAWIKCAKYNPMTLLGWVNVLDYPTIASTILEIWYTVANDSKSMNPSKPWIQEMLSDTDPYVFREGLQDAISQFSISDVVSNDSVNDGIFESLFLARNLLHITESNNEKEALWSRIVPDIPTLCQVLEDLTTQLVQLLISQMTSSNKKHSNDSSCNNEEKWIFLCLELIQLASSNVATMEEGSRRILINTIKNLLANVVTPDDLLEGCVKALLQLSCLDDHRDIEIEILPMIERLTETTVSSDNELFNVHTSIRIISLITLVLESRESTKPLSVEAMKSFLMLVRPTITSENNLLRQAGVRVWGMIGLYMNSEAIDNEISKDEYISTLLEIACNEVEEIEIRVQSMFALTDYFMIQFRILGVSAENICGTIESLCCQIDQFFHLPTKISQGTICCAAEMATKLLICMLMNLSNFDNEHQHTRIRFWFARLVVLYFDYETVDQLSIDDEEINGDSIHVGSPVRMQQLLSVFFPALAMTPAFQIANSYLLESIDSLLTLMQQQESNKKKKKTGRLSPTATKTALQWTRSLDFILSNVKKMQENNGTEPAIAPSTTDAAVVAMIDDDEDSTDNAETNVVESEVEIVDETSTVLEQCTKSSPCLIASVQVASFLSEHSTLVQVTIRRALCKWIATQMVNLDIESEQWGDLSRFKAILEELVESDGVDDTPSRRTLEPVLKLLSSVESDDDGDGNDEDDDESESADEAISSLSKDIGKITIVTDGNENISSKVDTIASDMKHLKTTSNYSVDGVRSRASRRLRPSN